MIRASAPVRICDNGGWTDTWFGGPGRILNIAVTPGVEVSIRTTAGPDPVVLDVESFGDRYSLVPRAPRVARHPLLEAALDAFPPPRGLAVEVSVRSGVPAGCGTGTSAAVAVALLGGLAALRHEERSPRDIAYAAHRLEVDILGVQSGIQDQLSAAFGGINYLEIETYPEARVYPLPTWVELEPPAHAGLPWSPPRLLGRAPPGHRGGGASRVRGVLAVASCGGRGTRRCPCPGSRRFRSGDDRQHRGAGVPASGACGRGRKAGDRARGGARRGRVEGQRGRGRRRLRHDLERHPGDQRGIR